MSSVASPALGGGAVNRPCGYAQHTVTTTVKNLDDTPTTGKRLSQCEGVPMRAIIQAETQGIRWTDDEDVAPTAAIGMLIPLGTTLEYDGDLTMFRFINAVAGAVLNISFYNS